MKKRIIVFLLAVTTLFAFAAEDLTVEEFQLPLTTEFGTKDHPLSEAQKFVLDMGFGWNLGNTFDASAQAKAGVSSETSWGQPKTTKAMFDGLVASGIKTVRIPISYRNHFIDDNYTIDPEWLARIKEVVDWAIEDGLYVIINTHHDVATYARNIATKPIRYNSGYYPLELHKEESLKFLTSVWKQVAIQFKDYDEKLIFEIMNEPRLHAGSNHPCAEGNHEWAYVSECPTCREAARMLVEYNQKCVDVIRAAGGQNKKNRYIMLTPTAAKPEAAFEYLEGTNTPFFLVKDSAKNHLILSVHMYTPYDFAMNVWKGERKYFTQADKETLDSYFETLNDEYIRKGIPVIIGEMGATNKDNLRERAEWFAYFAGNAKCFGITCCLWDNGNPKAGEEGYGYYNRTAQEWYFPILHQVAIDNVNYVTEMIHENMKN